jgi:hypothetical protein
VAAEFRRSDISVGGGALLTYLEDAGRDFQGGEVSRGFVARRGGHECLNGGDRPDAAAGALGHAVHGGGGTGEVELALERPSLQGSVDEAGVEDVAGAGGVDGADAVGGGVVQVLSIPGEDAIGAQGGSGERASVAALQLLQGLREIRLAGKAAGEIAADDEVVDVLDERVHAGVGFIQIGDNGDTSGAGPAGGEDGGGGVMPIDVECARVDDPLAAELLGLEGDTLVAAAENGAFAIGIDEDQRARAGGAGNVDELAFDAGAMKLVCVQLGCRIVTELAHVAGGEAPGLAGDDGGRDLPTGADDFGLIFDFGTALGELRYVDDGVGGVQAHAHDVNLRRLRHVVILGRRPC